MFNDKELAVVGVDESTDGSNGIIVILVWETQPCISGMTSNSTRKQLTKGPLSGV